MKLRVFFWISAVMAVWLLNTVDVVRAGEITPKTSQPSAGQALDKAPEEVVLVFAQELVLQGSDLQVFDASGMQVDQGGGGFDLSDPQHATLRVKLSALKEGVYTVKWKIKLLNGNSTDGSFHFGVGKVQVPTESADDDGLDASQAARIPKSSDAKGSDQPIILIGVGLAALVVMGVVIFLFRRK